VFPGEEMPAAEIKPAGDMPVWIPPILLTVATEGTGIPELAQAITRHARHLRETGDWQRRERTRLQSELDALLQETLVDRWRSSVSEAGYHQVLQDLVERQISPWRAVSILLDGGGS
jgi:LAO/AO transport system kinase